MACVKERIQKVLANAGIASRRAVEEMVRDGRIWVNGERLTELPILIDPEVDHVDVDDERIKLTSPSTARRFYIIMNKPRGVYSTNVAQGEQKRAIDLLPPAFRARVYPVGRLDADSKGLLLLTNDGELTNHLTHPRYGVAKTYRAVVQGFIETETVERLSQGVWLADRRRHKGFKATPGSVKIVKRTRQHSLLEITLHQGHNRQVRRMLAAEGHKVRELTRIRLGPLTLDGLKPGQSRPLSAQELRQLLKVAHQASEKGGSSDSPPRRRKSSGTKVRTGQSSTVKPHSNKPSAARPRPSKSPTAQRRQGKVSGFQTRQGKPSVAPSRSGKSPAAKSRSGKSSSRKPRRS